MDELPRGRRVEMEEIRRRHPNAYLPWTGDEDAQLVAGYRAGAEFDELAVRFGRQPSAIESRLKLLALRLLRESA